jgi:hypothetical protein
MAQQPLVGQDLSNLQDHNHTHHIRQKSSGRVVVLSQEPLRGNTQHSQGTDIYAHSGTQTRKPSKQSAADSRLGRQRREVYRLLKFCIVISTNTYSLIITKFYGTVLHQTVISFTPLSVYSTIHNTEWHRRKILSTSVLRWEIQSLRMRGNQKQKFVSRNVSLINMSDLPKIKT